MPELWDPNPYFDTYPDTLARGSVPSLRRAQMPRSINRHDEEDEADVPIGTRVVQLFTNFVCLKLRHSVPFSFLWRVSLSSPMAKEQSLKIHYSGKGAADFPARKIPELTPGEITCALNRLVVQVTVPCFCPGLSGNPKCFPSSPNNRGSPTTTHLWKVREAHMCPVDNWTF